MEDKDFDNIFGDKLKEQKDFPFSEEKWTQTRWNCRTKDYLSARNCRKSTWN